MKLEHPVAVPVVEEAGLLAGGVDDGDRPALAVLHLRIHAHLG